MRGFLYSGIILIVIFVMLFALVSLTGFYDYFNKKIYLKYGGDTLYQGSLDIARLLSYGKQNVIQDALSDSIALATELSLNNKVSNYTYIVANLSLPNNIISVNSVIYLDDNFPVSCYYKANYVSYIPQIWDLGSYPYYPGWTNNNTNQNWKVMGIFNSNQNTTRTLPLTPDQYTLKFKFCHINNAELFVYLNNQLESHIAYSGNGSVKCENVSFDFIVNYKRFYNITIKSTATQWSVDQIILEKNNTINNLFIYNISQVVCVGNNFLSTKALLCEKNKTKSIIYNYWAYSNWTGSSFVGCENITILNTSDFIGLTNYQNYTWYYLTKNKTLFKEFLINKVLIGNNLSNLNINISNPMNFTYSSVYSINRSKDLDHPNYDYLKYDLDYNLYSADEFGGITGTGFDNLSCSSKSNYNSKINCEVEPFITNYSSDYHLMKPIQIPLKVCKKLSENNYALIKQVLGSYATDVFKELLSKTKYRKNIEVLSVSVKNYPVDCTQITTENGFNFTIDVCVKYRVSTFGFPYTKTSTVCSKRILWFDFHEKTFGEDSNIKTPHGKYAYRVFYKQPNILYLPNVTKYVDDTTHAEYPCSIICRENITGVKYTGEKLFYSDIKVIDILRSGFDPDNYLFDHPFHILTTSYKTSQIYSVCDSIKDLVDSGKTCNYIPRALRESISLNNSSTNIISDFKQLPDNTWLLEINVSDNLYPEFVSVIRYRW